MPHPILLIAICLGVTFGSSAQEKVRFESAQWTTNHDVNLRLTQGIAPFVKLERSTDLLSWEPVTAFKNTKTNAFLDSGAGYRSNAYYRAIELEPNDTLTGDYLMTESGPIIFHPVNHASFVMTWNGLTIYNDPVGSASLYNGIPRADVILVSHDHGDHFEAATLTALRRTNGTPTAIFAPQVVYNSLNSTLKGLTTILTNGAGTNVLGFRIDAVPAYNGNHPQGRGNGYVVTLGGKRLYMSGDTGAINEIKGLANIDVAFLCINVPYTMTVSQASAIVREFKPRVVYPYHLRNADGTYSDVNLFRRQVGSDLGIEVRARKWY